MNREVRRMLRELGADPAPRILEVFKRRGRETVTGVSRVLGLSYMTARNHCGELKKAGYLETWRHARPTGRPEILYFLSKKGESFFTDRETGDWMLQVFEASKALYGPTSPEKLLYSLFEARAAAYSGQLKKGTLTERLTQLGQIRDAEGRMSEVTKRGDEVALRECVDPLAELVTAYPVAERLEVEMLATIFGCSVRLERDEAPGLGPRFFIFESPE